MRLMIELRHEDREHLERIAWEEHRDIREEAGFLLHQAIQARWAQQQQQVETDTEALDSVA